MDLGFYDSQEVKSIPRRVRAAAIGVWVMCGTYSANKLQDGYVDAETLKDLGCTPAIRAALTATKPDPLWVDDEESGGIWLTRWSKWQRTRAEVKAYRESEAERKRLAREAKKRTQEQQSGDNQTGDNAHQMNSQGGTNAYLIDNQGEDNANVDDERAPDDGIGNPSICDDGETSGRTTAGRPQNVRPESRDPKTKAETKSESSSVLTLVEGGPGGSEPLPVADKPAPGSRGTRLPDNWMPSESTIQAMRKQFPYVNLQAEHEKFTDHWIGQPGAKGRKANWDATWRNWIRRTAENARPAHRNNGPMLSTADQRVAQVQALKNSPPTHRLELS